MASRIIRTALFALTFTGALAHAAARDTDSTRPVDLVNGLVGTAALDDPADDT